jgi:hypothetical protein
MEIIIQDSYQLGAVDIYLQRENLGRIEVIGYDGNVLIFQPIPDIPTTDNKIKPLLSIPYHMKDAIIKAFIQEGAKQNLRTDNENLLKGKLEATEKHLADMQKAFNQLLELTKTK